jgi:hypothetical protein
VDDRRGVLWREPVTDPMVADRFAALERVQLARRALERERERAVEAAARASAAEAETTHLDPEDVEHLLEIHGSLEVERRAARRPFAKNGREIMSFELAERLVLERLGFASYEDFEADLQVEAPLVEVIDLAELSRLEQDVADAEAELARISTAGGASALAPALPRRQRPSTTELPVRLAGRTTSARKEVFGTGTGFAPERRPNRP